MASAARSRTHHVPIVCDELGADRAQWIHDVRTALETDHMGWTTWNDRGSFGVVTKTDVPDPLVAQALGLRQH